MASVWRSKENNVGWRIDYVFASPGASKLVKKAFIWPEEMGSDHCPLAWILPVERDKVKIRI